MSLLDPIDEAKLMAEAGKQLKPLLDQALTRLEAVIDRLRAETEVEIVIRFRRKEQ